MFHFPSEHGFETELNLTSNIIRVPLFLILLFFSKSFKESPRPSPSRTHPPQRKPMLHHATILRMILGVRHSHLDREHGFELIREQTGTYVPRLAQNVIVVY